MTNSSVSLLHTRPKAEHSLFTAASGKMIIVKRKSGKKKKKEKLRQEVWGQVDKVCVGGQLRMCRYFVKMSTSRKSIKTSNDNKDRSDGALCHYQGKHSANTLR